ncbi:MAG: hypothetical protein AMXMBFR84_47270 [Candidatus Hydrogenedentota bacterium]
MKTVGEASAEAVGHGGGEEAVAPQQLSQRDPAQAATKIP